MTLGSKIRLSRRACYLSLRDLAAKIDGRVTAQTISKYERDESIPSSSVLIAISNALGVPTDFLVNGSDIRIEAVEFRKNRPTNSKEESLVEATVLNMLERYLAVEEILGLPNICWDELRESTWPILQDLAEAENASLNMRNHWGLGFEPIPNFVNLLEERGIKVIMLSLSNFDGLTARVRCKGIGVVPIFVVNGDVWGESQRFTLARELGHMTLDPAPKINKEKAAIRFASSFLMPAEKLRFDIGNHRSSISWGELIEIKRIYGVSLLALVNRCKELGIFNTKVSQNLLNQIRNRGWRNASYEEPGSISCERSMRFERLCFRALSEGAISEAKASELLGYSVAELNRQMDIPEPID